MPIKSGKIIGSDSRKGVLSETFCRGRLRTPVSVEANAGEKDRSAQPQEGCPDFRRRENYPIEKRRAGKSSGKGNDIRSRQSFS